MSYYMKSTITRISYAQLLYVCDTMTITFTGVNSVRIWQSGLLLKTLWITPKSGPQTINTKKI
jgi:hypothetical protein